MKKILKLILVFTLCLGLTTVSLAVSQPQPRYTNISSIAGTARAISSTKILCSVVVNTYTDQDVEIELVVTDENGDEVVTYLTSNYDNIVALEETVSVKAGGTYTCTFSITCGADRPVITRTVRT